MKQGILAEWAIDRKVPAHSEEDFYPQLQWVLKSIRSLLRKALGRLLQDRPSPQRNVVAYTVFNLQRQTLAEAYPLSLTSVT